MVKEINNSVSGSWFLRNPSLSALNPVDVISSTANFADVSVHPACLEALHIWRELRGGRLCPDRADFDPVVLPRSLLPSLALFDVDQGDRTRFRVRLMGTAIVSGYGADYTGRWVDQIPFGTAADYWAEHFGRCVDLERPVWGRIRHDWEGRPWVLQHWLKAPLTHKSEEINMLLACDVFERVPGNRP